MQKSSQAKIKRKSEENGKKAQGLMNINLIISNRKKTKSDGEEFVSWRSSLTIRTHPFQRLLT